MTAFLFLAAIVLIFVVAYLSIQAGRTEREIERLRLTIESIDRAQSRADVRIGALESATRKPRPEPSPPVAVTPEPPPLPKVDSEPIAAPVLKPEPKPESAPAPHPVFSPDPAKPVTDWESVIGGNWANKAGVAVLVIGLALFLQYSLTHLGPAGRVALGYLLGVVLLGAGLTLDRRDNWRLYARGLIGGGWAAIYFTSYAAHAIPAARVIADPVTASVLLLAVALGMVLHSLRYRSQTVTGIAYFVTFGTLAITPLSLFAVVAVVPLAASLLYIARRFGWYPMMALGQIAVYVLYLIHIGKIGLHPHRLVYGQIVLGVYWGIFEASELSLVPAQNAFLKLRFFINALAMIAISLAQWGSVRPATIWIPCFVLGTLYLASTFIRATRVSPGTETIENLALGGYEGAVTISAGLIAGGISSVCRGFWIDGAWLIEAEILFGCSLYFGRRFLAQLAAVVFVLPVGKLTLRDIPDYPPSAWSPLALFGAALFSVNRFLRCDLPAYAFAAMALFCSVISFTAPPQWVAILWLLVAAVLFEAGLHESWADLRAVSYAIAIPAATWILFQNLQVGLLAWPVQVAAVVQGCAYFTRIVALRGSRLEQNEANRLLSASAALTAISLAGLTAAQCPNWFLAPAWFAIALLLAETGFRFRLEAVRAEAHLLMLFALGAAFAYDLSNRSAIWGLSMSLLAISPVIASYYCLRYRTMLHNPAPWERKLTRIYLWVAALLSMLLVQTELDRVLVPIGWAAIGFVLLLISVRNNVPDLRKQAYLIAIATFIRVAMVFLNNGHTFGISDAILAACPAIALFFVSGFLLPKQNDPARPATSVVASVLLAWLLYTEVRGSLLTVAWGAQGLLTLAAGFPLRERALRFCGLGIFLLCVFKLFFYDFSALSTPYRIISFLVLGVLLLGASGLYTRFRETIRQYF